MQQITSLLIIADTHSQHISGPLTCINGFKRKFTALTGAKLHLITVDDFPSFKMPLYPEIRVPFCRKKTLERRIKFLNPDAIFIMTEGRLGWVARRICMQEKYAFCSYYATQFPEYIYRYLRIPLNISYKILKHFHSKATHTIVPSRAMVDLLSERGFRNIVCYTPGADLELFKPQRPPAEYKALKKTILLYLGRVAKEKNMEAFLDMDLPGTKVVVGKGPLLEAYRLKYKDVVFLGEKKGQALPQYYQADVMVFPSLTDTFGRTIIESIACGTPVAGYAAACGVQEIVRNGVNGFGDADLKVAILKALECKPRMTAYNPQHLSEDQYFKTFYQGLVPKKTA